MRWPTFFVRISAPSAGSNNMRLAALLLSKVPPFSLRKKRRPTFCRSRRNLFRDSFSRRLNVVYRPFRRRRHIVGMHFFAEVSAKRISLDWAIN